MFSADIFISNIVLVVTQSSTPLNTILSRLQPPPTQYWALGYKQETQSKIKVVWIDILKAIRMGKINSGKN
jgi:hypothetical protein